jgi:hypothetical protein
MIYFRTVISILAVAAATLTATEAFTIGSTALQRAGTGLFSEVAIAATTEDSTFADTPRHTLFVGNLPFCKSHACSDYCASNSSLLPRPRYDLWFFVHSLVRAD